MIRTSNFKLVPLSTDFFAIECNYLRINSLSDYVIVKTSGGDSFEMAAGDYVEFKNTIRLEIYNPMAFEQYISISTGNGSEVFGSSRIKGEVSVINGELKRVKDNQAFIAGISVLPVNNGICALVNFDFSEFNVFINKVLIYNRALNASTGAASCEMGMFDSTALFLTPDNIAKSKSQADIIASGQLYTKRIDSATSLSALSGYKALSGFDAEQNKPFFYDFTEPLLIRKGSVLAIGATAAGGGFMRVNFQGYIEKIV